MEKEQIQKNVMVFVVLIILIITYQFIKKFIGFEATVIIILCTILSTIMFKEK